MHALWMDLKGSVLSVKSQHKGLCPVPLHFYDFLEKAKQAHKLDHWVPVAGEEEVIDCKGHKGISRVMDMSALKRWFHIRQKASHFKFKMGAVYWGRWLVGYSPWGCRVRHNWATKHTHSCLRKRRKRSSSSFHNLEPLSCLSIWNIVAYWLGVSVSQDTQQRSRGRMWGVQLDHSLPTPATRAGGLASVLAVFSFLIDVTSIFIIFSPPPSPCSSSIWSVRKHLVTSGSPALPLLEY